MPDLSIDRMNRDHVELVLRLCGGCKLEAAKELDISRNTLTRWLQRWESEDRRKAAEQPAYILLTKKWVVGRLCTFSVAKLRLALKVEGLHLKSPRGPNHQPQDRGHHSHPDQQRAETEARKPGGAAKPRHANKRPCQHNKKPNRH